MEQAGAMRSRLIQSRAEWSVTIECWFGGHEIDAQPNDSQVLSVKGDIGDLADLDTFQTTGLFHPPSNLLAENGINYPVQRAELLKVVTSGEMSFQLITFVPERGVNRTN